MFFHSAGRTPCQPRPLPGETTDQYNARQERIFQGLRDVVRGFWMILGIFCGSANVLFWLVFFIDFFIWRTFLGDVFFTDDYHVEAGDSKPPKNLPGEAQRRSSRATSAKVWEWHHEQCDLAASQLLALHSLEWLGCGPR